jgi:hypothetical protein
MGLKIRHIATRFALILAVAAILPLVVYGAWSILSLQGTTEKSIASGNLNVATRAAEEIRRYISTDAKLLRSTATNLEGLSDSEKDNILKSYGLDFREFAEITLLNEAGGVVATSTAGKPLLGIPTDRASVSFDGVRMSSIHTTGLAAHGHLRDPSRASTGLMAGRRRPRVMEDGRQDPDWQHSARSSSPPMARPRRLT